MAVSNKRKNTRGQSLLQLALLIGILIFVNILGNAFFTQMDLTNDRRYTLTENTVEIVESVDEIISITVLLDGDLPANVKYFQKAIKEKLDDFRSISKNIEYIFDDPNAGSSEEVNNRRKILAEDGIMPKNISVDGLSERKQILAYPYAIIRYKGRTVTVDLLEDGIPGAPLNSYTINNSIRLLEYKFANAFKTLDRTRKPAILYTKGHGELRPIEVLDLSESLLPYYDLGFLHLDSVNQIQKEVAAVVIAKPRGPFSDRDKFKIDQYIMNGGKVIFLIDRMAVHLDSLRKSELRKEPYVPRDYNLNLEDMLYKYGVRVQPGLVADLQASPIPQVTDTRGTMKLFPYYYHLLAKTDTDHPITGNIDYVNMLFPSSIDTTVRVATNLKKEVILASSDYSKEQFSPIALDFEILKYEPDTSWFPKKQIPLAVLLDGEFPSLYANQVSEEMKANLRDIGQEFKSTSVPTQVLVVSDGDVIKNPINPKRTKHYPLGFNQYAGYIFGNKDFMINAIEYVINERGVIDARNKRLKLRLLNKKKAKIEQNKWRMINILFPLLFLLLIFFIYRLNRKRKYQKAA